MPSAGTGRASRDEKPPAEVPLDDSSPIDGVLQQEYNLIPAPEVQADTFVIIHGIMLQIPQALQVLDWFDALTEEQQKSVEAITEESFAADESIKALLLNSLNDAGIDLDSWRSIVKDADYGLEKWVDDIRQKKIEVEDGSLHSWRQ